MLAFEDSHSIVTAFSVESTLDGSGYSQYGYGDGDVDRDPRMPRGDGGNIQARFCTGYGNIGDHHGDSRYTSIHEGIGWGY